MSLAWYECIDREELLDVVRQAVVPFGGVALVLGPPELGRTQAARLVAEHLRSFGFEPLIRRVDPGRPFDVYAALKRIWMAVETPEPGTIAPWILGPHLGINDVVMRIGAITAASPRAFILEDIDDIGDVAPGVPSVLRLLAKETRCPVVATAGNGAWKPSPDCSYRLKRFTPLDIRTCVVRTPRLRRLPHNEIESLVSAICGDPPSEVIPEIAYETLAMLEASL